MLRLALVAAAAAALLAAGAVAQQAPVRVFVLAGQSNMEGKAQNKLWEHKALVLASTAWCTDLL